ncbi:uncharacterized protein [Nicotiana tomentosiformis]|uniref:uncharacterized protein n=1 Tax=Nicotiana tomentosiformis TaxID=4098 RepID=UPI00388CBAB2
MSSEALWRLDRFTKLFPVYFSGASSEDPQDYLDSCHEVLRNMGIVETNGVDFAAFHLSGSAKKWWRDYVLTKPAGSPALIWDQSLSYFLRSSFLSLRERTIRGSSSVFSRALCLSLSTRHDLWIWPVKLFFCFLPRERVRRFIEGLYQPIKLQMVKETGSEIFFRRLPMLPDESRWGTFSRGHPPRPFHSALQASHGASGGRIPHKHYSDQLAYSAPPAPISAPLLPSFQGGYLGRQARPEAESSDVVIIGTVSICSRDASVLFDPGSTYSYVSSYFASYLVVPRDSLSATVYVSTHVGDAIVIDRV